MLHGQPITGGTIEAGEKFTPRINSTSITGTDNAVLSEEESILHLNVDAEALSVQSLLGATFTSIFPILKLCFQPP